MGTNTAYCTATDFAQWAMNDQSAMIPEQGLIDLVIDAASREVEEYCNRQFPGFNADTVTSSRVYAVDNPFACFTDDIADDQTVSVAVDLNGDGTFEQAWKATDFQLEPANAIIRGHPINMIRVRGWGLRWFPVSTGSGYVRINGLNTMAYVGGGSSFGAYAVKGALSVQVTAKWGWPAVPPPVKQATLIQAHHLYTTKGAPLGIVMTPELASSRVTSFLHPTAARLLRGYRKGEGLV